MTVSPTGGGVVKATGLNNGCESQAVKIFPGEHQPVTCFLACDVQFEAVPNTGYKFSGWKFTGGVTYTGTRNPYTVHFPISASVSINVVATFTPGVTPPPAGATAVTLDQAKAMIDGTKPVIVIDVREAYDYNAGHIVCAQNYPWSSGVLRTDYTDFINFKSYDILVYGQSRSPSIDAANFLVEKGFTSVYHMTDGMTGWVQRGWHTIDDDCDCETCSLPPMAHAGPDQTKDEGALVTLDGSGSKIVGGLITGYHWVQIDGVQMVTLSNENAVKPTFTAPAVQQGGDTLVFNLTVTNDSGQKDTDSVSVNVQWVNTAVEAEAGPDQSVMAGDSVTLNGSGSNDPDGEIVTYHWALDGASSAIDTSQVVLSNPSGAITKFTAPDVRGWIRFRLTVTDDSGETDFDFVMITINTEGGASGLEADAGQDQVAAEGSTVTMNGSWSSSLDAVVTSYQWTKVSGPAIIFSGSDGMAPEASRDINPTFIAPVIGTGQTELILRFYIRDTKGATDTDDVKVIVNSQAYINASQPPVADAGLDRIVTPGALVTLDGSGSSDPENKIFSYKWTKTSGPDAIILSDSTSVQPTFSAPYASGFAIFQMIVMDDAGWTDQASVKITWVNGKPVANAGPDQDAFEKEIVELHGSGSSDPDDGIATYQWTKISGPAVVLSDSSAADPIFTAPETSIDPIVLVFKLTVTDKNGQSSTDQVEITVNNKNDVPIANAGADQRVNETAKVTLNGTGSSDADGDPMTYQWHQISGPAVSLRDAFTATPTFRAPSIGVQQAKVVMQLSVTDTENQTSTDKVEITIDDVGKAPIADAGDDMSVYEKQSVTLDGSGSKDFDGEITYLWTQTGGRTAILSDVSAAAPTFTVPLVNPDSNVLTFELMVEDNDGLVAFDEVSLMVDPVTEPPVADAGPDQEVKEKDIVTLDASGSTDPDDGIVSYEWTQASGIGVVLSDSSAIQPTFEAPEIDEPSVILSFRVTVKDASMQERADFVEITVDRKSSGGGGGCFISSMTE